MKPDRVAYAMAFEARYFHFQQVAIQGPRTDCKTGSSTTERTFTCMYTRSIDRPLPFHEIHRQQATKKEQNERDLVTHRCHASRIYLLCVQVSPDAFKVISFYRASSSYDAKSIGGKVYTGNKNRSCESSKHTFHA